MQKTSFSCLHFAGDPPKLGTFLFCGHNTRTGGLCTDVYTDTYKAVWHQVNLPPASNSATDQTYIPTSIQLSVSMDPILI